MRPAGCRPRPSYGRADWPAGVRAGRPAEARGVHYRSCRHARRRHAGCRRHRGRGCPGLAVPGPPARGAHGRRVQHRVGHPGLPGARTRARARNPIQHREFLTRPEVRARYLGRSLLGWPRFSSAKPNAAHQALAAAGAQTARCWGSSPRTWTGCTTRPAASASSSCTGRWRGCGAWTAASRRRARTLQERLLALNPGFAERDVRAAAGRGRRAGRRRWCGPSTCPAYLRCGGTLKPDVVFFGDNVPPTMVEAAFSLLEEGDALLMVGCPAGHLLGYRFRSARRTATCPSASSTSASAGATSWRTCAWRARGRRGAPPARGGTHLSLKGGPAQALQGWRERRGRWAGVPASAAPPGLAPRAGAFLAFGSGVSPWNRHRMASSRCRTEPSRETGGSSRRC